MTVTDHAADSAPAEVGTGFCDVLRAASQDIWEATLRHPFLAEVEAGTLPDEKLLFYFIQNVHYIDAAIAFNAEAAAKAPDELSREFAFRLLDFGRNEVPRQREYVRRLTGTVSASFDLGLAPTTRAYTNHLRALASYGGSLDLFVGLLPCEWTYSDFGSRLAPVVRHPVTAEWLSTFGGADHNDMNIKYKGVLDHLVADVGAERREELSRIFRTSIRYEWMFWQMAYTLEQWPV
jgi:thiaminase (transcriptional activator TenA)